MDRTATAHAPHAAPVVSAGTPTLPPATGPSPYRPGLVPAALAWD